MDLIDLRCTHCGASLPGAHPGTNVRCQYCGHTFVVEANQPPPPPPPAPGVFRIEIVAPGGEHHVRNIPRRSSGPGAAVFIGPIFALIIGGAVYSQLRRAGVTGGLPSISSPSSSIVGGRFYWDSVGGQPIPATVAGHDAVIGRTRGPDDQLSVVAVDSASADIKWKVGPLGTYSEGYQATHYALVRDRVVVTDFHNVARVVDLATGTEKAKASLSDKVEMICVSHPSEAVWIGTIDKRGATLDMASGATHEAPRPATCEDAWARFSSSQKSPPGVATPKIAGFDSRRVVVEGDAAVASGHRSPGTAIPLAVGFDPKTGAVRWNQPVASIDPSSVKDSSNVAEAINSGRFYTVYEPNSKAWHVTALDAHTGARLWDTQTRKVFAVDSIDGIAASPLHVYVVRTSSLDIYDAKTGHLVGAVGNETYKD